MNNEKYDLNGKTALITGASGLLGIEHAQALLNSRARVILTDIHLENLKKTENSLVKINPRDLVSIKYMDVTKEQSVLDVYLNLVNQNISIDILINNAAVNPKLDKESSISSSSRLENFSVKEWDREISVGLTGAFICSKVFGNHMAKSKKGGCILNIASDLSVIAPDQRIYKKENIDDSLQPVKPVTYSVIKSGLIGLTKYLSTYWLGASIRCNSLSPGGVYNEQPEIFIEKLSNLIPLGRMARKDEYRSAIQFLCSDASSYMNGHNLVMDGGRSTW